MFKRVTSLTSLCKPAWSNPYKKRLICYSHQPFVFIPQQPVQQMELAQFLGYECRGEFRVKRTQFNSSQHEYTYHQHFSVQSQSNQWNGLEIDIWNSKDGVKTMHNERDSLCDAYVMTDALQGEFEGPRRWLKSLLLKNAINDSNGRKLYFQSIC